MTGLGPSPWCLCVFARVTLSPSFACERQQLQDPAGAEWNFVYLSRERQQRVPQGVGNRRRRSNRSPLAQPFYTQGIERRRRLDMDRLYFWHFHRTGQKIIHEATAQQLTVGIVANLFVKRSADPLSDAAMDLPFHQQGIEQFPRIVRDDVVQ